MSVTSAGTPTVVSDITLTNVTADVDVTLNYVLDKYEVKAVTPWTSTVDGVKANGTDIADNGATITEGTAAAEVEVTKPVTLTIALGAALGASESIEVTVKKNSDSSTVAALSGTATKVITDASGQTYTYTFTMPAYDVDVDVQIVDSNPDIDVTPYFTAVDTGLSALDYSVSTAPATTASATSGTGITAKKGNVITFKSAANFFVGVDTDADPSTAVTSVTAATKLADGTYAYEYTVGSADVDLTFYATVTVTVLNQTDGVKPLTWNNSFGQGTTNAISGDFEIVVPFKCAWITFTDPSHTIQLDVDDSAGSGPVHGVNYSVAWSTAISADETLTVTTNTTT